MPDNNVRQLREAQLMSKAELARKAGVSPLTIDRVESGKPCRMDTKRKIILALGYELTDRERVFPDERPDDAPRRAGGRKQRRESDPEGEAAERAASTPEAGGEAGPPEASAAAGAERGQESERGQGKRPSTEPKPQAARPAGESGDADEPR